MLVLAPLDTLAAKVDAGGTDVNYDVTGMIYDSVTKAVTTPVTGNHGDVPTTAAPIVTAAASNTSLHITGIRLYNSSGSTRTVSIYIDRNDAAPDYDADTLMDTIELLTGEAAEWSGGPSWVIKDAKGVAKMSVISPIAATQAEQEGGTAMTTFVSPGRQHFHPSGVKAWGKATVSGAVPTLAVSYNITSITDTATDQLTVTIATDFSTAHYAVTASIEAATTTLSATTTSLTCFIRNATLLAGSFIIQACEFDIGAATDPASWHWQACGDHA